MGEVKVLLPLLLPLSIRQIELAELALIASALREHAVWCIRDTLDNESVAFANRPDKSVLNLANYTVYHLLGGRGFVCFVFDPASVHGPKTKHTNLLPQADERQCTPNCIPLASRFRGTCVCLPGFRVK